MKAAGKGEGRGVAALRFLSGGRIPGGILLVLGEDVYLRWKVVCHVGNLAGVEPERVSAAEMDAGEILDRLRTPGLFQEKTVLCVEGINDFLRKCRDGGVDLSSLVVPSHAVLLLSGESVDRRLSAAGALLRGGVVIDCNVPSATDMASWVRGVLESEGKRPAGNVPSAVVARAGTDFASVETAVEQLLLFLGKKETVSLKDVAAAVPRGCREVVWDMTTSLTRGELGKAVGVLEELLDAGEHPQMLMGALAWLLKRLLHAVYLLDEGVSPRDVCRKLRMRQEELSRLRRLGPTVLKEWMSILLDADRDMKTGVYAGGERVIMERMLVEMGAAVRRRKS